MKHYFLATILLLSINFFGQKGIDISGKSQKQITAYLDSAMKSYNFITLKEASNVIDKPAILTDSMYRYANGLLRSSLTFVAKYVDSTSKGRIFFSFDQYEEEKAAKDVFNALKTEYERNGKPTVIENLGEENVVQKDAINQPFIVVRSKNKIYKIRIYYITTPESLKAATDLLRKVIKNH